MTETLLYIQSFDCSKGSKEIDFIENYLKVKAEKKKNKKQKTEEKKTEEEDVESVKSI